MPEVIHDLNLRNIAGAVCYTIASEAFGVPAADGAGNLISLSRCHAEAFDYSPVLCLKSEEASQRVKPLIDVIAGATSRKIRGASAWRSIATGALRHSFAATGMDRTGLLFTSAAPVSI